MNEGEWAEQELIKKYGSYENYLNSPEGKTTKELIERTKLSQLQPPTPDVVVGRREPTQEEIEQSRVIIRENYDKIRHIIGEYMDIPEDDKILDALWIIGTYFHKEFETFPYLFFNAMKGSGKTRLCKLLKHLAWKGWLLTSLKEATLFRAAGKHTLIIDEFEHIGKKGEENLRELLNASYKKGLSVIRMKKVKTPEGEEQVMEKFEPYTPIIMANIWGMEDVLNDRCITQILEKSNNPLLTKKVEDFDNNLLIKQIKLELSVILVYMCSYFGRMSIYAEWNHYVNEHYNTLTTLHTYTTQTTLTTPKNILLEEIFLKIDNSGLEGRNLELWMPLFLIAKIVGDEVFEKIITIAKKYVSNKKVEELTESKDIMLIEFVSKQDGSWYMIKELAYMFRQYISASEDEDHWINARWVGRALKRLALVVEKKRIGEGIQVILNFEKAKKKMEMFR